MASKTELAARFARAFVASIAFVAAPAYAGAATDFTPAGTQPGVHAVLPSVGCRGCHGSQSPEQALTIAWDTWAGSMMSHATRDPVFWAALDVANADAPGSGDFCLRCHAPQAWLDGRVAK